MSTKFPGHYPSSVSSPAPSHRFSTLINMSETVSSVYGSDYDNADVPLSATLLTTPISNFGGIRPTPLKEEDEDDLPVEEASLPPPTPPPTYTPHPKYFFDDASVFILIEGYLFKIHQYLFLPDDGNVINNLLKEGPSSEKRPLILSGEIRISSFENILRVLYRHPLERTPLHIKLLKDAILTAHALSMNKLCDYISKHIVATDCPDEPLDEAVPKYMLAVKLPNLFPPAFRDAQIDKICCAAAYMTHSHMFELGFQELAKVWRGAFVARAGYDGQRTETYQPPPVAPRTSYLIRVKNEANYRAMKRDVFGA